MGEGVRVKFIGLAESDISMEVSGLGASAWVRLVNAVTTVPRRLIERAIEEYFRAANIYL